MTKRAYVVSLMEGTPIRTGPSAEIKALRTEVHHIGNNINQIARVANTCGYVRQSDLNEIKEMQSRIWQKVKWM